MPAADSRPVPAARLLRAGLLPLLITVGLTTPAAHADELKPFEVSYSALYHGFTIAQATLTLVRRDADTWVYTSKTESRGFARLLTTPPVKESVMRVSAAGVQPLSFRVGSGSPSTPKDIQLRFDWETGRLSGLYESAQLDMLAPPGTQDQLSIGIDLVNTLVRGKQPDQVVLMDGKTPHHYRFVREKEEILNTKIGKVPTIVYSRTKAEGPEFSRFWLAPGYGFVPMKVEQKDDDGTQYSLVVLSIKR